MSIIVTAKGPVNIAVIKYWGKKNEDLLTPINDSLSLTLSTDQMCAKTTVAFSKSFTSNRIWLNGKEENIMNPRLQNCLREIKKRAKLEGNAELVDCCVHICSENNFPTAAGLASSAAGYACLVYVLGKAFGLKSNLSDIARQGSGSACRSMYGGFVQWVGGKLNDGSDSVAKEIVSESHWPEIRVLVLVVNFNQKETSSTSGMGRSVKTSELLKYRASSVVPQRIDEMTAAFKAKDFHKFAEITMKDSNQFHAICQDTYPPVRYMNETSWAIVDLVHQYNSFYGKNKVAYTFDAGPNACLFLLEPDVSEFASLVCLRFPPSSRNAEFFVGLPLMHAEQISKDLMSTLQFTPSVDSLKYIIHTKVGAGPEVSNDHLLNENGMPK